MKKKCLTGLGMILLAGLLMVGCGGSKDQNTESSVATETEGTQVEVKDSEVAFQETQQPRNHEGMAKSLLTGEWISADLAGKRPIAMMTENTKVILLLLK